MNELLDLYEEILMEKAYKSALLETEGHTERFFKEEAYVRGLWVSIRILGKYQEYREFAESPEGRELYREYKEDFLKKMA